MEGDGCTWDVAINCKSGLQVAIDVKGRRNGQLTRALDFYFLVPVLPSGHRMETNYRWSWWLIWVL